MFANGSFLFEHKTAANVIIYQWHHFKMEIFYLEHVRTESFPVL